MVSSVEGANIGEFQHLILLDLNFEAFRVLAEALGDEKAREIFKPHMLNSAMALLINAQKHLGLTINDVVSMNLIMAFIGHSIWRHPWGNTILTARGIEWHNNEGCTLSGAPSSLRRMVCDDASQGFFIAYPDYGMSQSCLDKGDCECGTILFNNVDPSTEWRMRGSKDTPIPHLHSIKIK